ncbi:tetratricopeptide repeat protein [Acidobacteria bacterium AH-259-O06]|nr:tetratricopeptide repeat protein [Acidobacteria bacterium AH-259-O06]
MALWLALGPEPGQAPRDFQATFHRGLQALERGELEAAEAAFHRAQQLQPQNSLVFFHLARIHLRRQEFRQAIVHFRKSISLDPEEPQSYFHLAALYSHLLRFLNARRTLNELLKVRPDFPDAYLMLARVAQEEGKHSLVERNLRHYLQLRPQDPEALSQLGAAMLAQESYPEAESLLKQALEKDSSLGQAHLDLGVLYSRQGEQQQARGHLEMATRLLPSDGQAHYHLGTVLARLDDVQNAEKALRKAIELAPKLAGAHYALGMLLHRLGRGEEASQLLAVHNRLNSADREDRQRQFRVTSFHQQIKELLPQDRLQEAQQKAGQILRLDPRNDFAHYRLAQIFYLRGEYQRSLDSVQSALRLRDVEPAYMVMEGMCLERLGGEQEAIAAYERALNLADYLDAYFRLGQLELRRGQAGQAVERLRRAVALQPENPRLLLALADALEQAGQHQEGLKQRNKAHSLQEKPSPP